MHLAGRCRLVPMLWFCSQVAVGPCWLATSVSAAPQQPGNGGTVSHAARPPAEDWVLANRHLRAVFRPDSLTLSVEDLATHERWSADPWENSAGRIHLRGKEDESVTVNLDAASEKNVDALPPGAQGWQGLEFRWRGSTLAWAPCGKIAIRVSGFLCLSISRWRRTARS